MPNDITPQPGISDIELYVGGASSVPGHANVLKLSSNENPFGPSPRALEAYAEAAGRLHLYPPTDHAGLRAAIAQAHGMDADRIVCGNGSDELLHLLAQGYAGPGDEVIYTEHGFGIYKIVAQAAGATPVEVPERERVIDADAILAAANDRTRLVYIANPANPTGTFLGASEVARLAEGLPTRAILVLDGAYAEFAAGYDAGQALVEARGNVVMTRTFSKIYGLGGLRIGWAYAPQPIVDTLNRIRGPFNLSAAARAAAEAAMRDRAYVERCRTENARLRDWLAHALAEAGVPSDTSSANFILARFASEAEALACNAALLAEGIIVRHPKSYGFPHCLRITVGDEVACRRVAEVVRGFMEGRA